MLNYRIKNYTVCWAFVIFAVR